MTKDMKIELYNDHFENAKRYGIPHAQLIVATSRYDRL
jgi:site-specific DNA-methyltransferase (adenine-specific)